MDVPDLDPLFHQATRFRIMLVLYRNRQAAATWIMKILGLTDGNLRSHAAKLVQAGYVAQGRVLTRDGFQVRFRIRPEGDAAFRAYVQSLETVLGSITDIQAGLPSDQGEDPPFPTGDE